MDLRVLGPLKAAALSRPKGADAIVAPTTTLT